MPSRFIYGTLYKLFLPYRPNNLLKHNPHCCLVKNHEKQSVEQYEKPAVFNAALFTEMGP